MFITLVQYNRSLLDDAQLLHSEIDRQISKFVNLKNFHCILSTKALANATRTVKQTDFTISLRKILYKTGMPSLEFDNPLYVCRFYEIIDQIYLSRVYYFPEKKCFLVYICSNCSR